LVVWQHSMLIAGWKNKKTR